MTLIQEVLQSRFDERGFLSNVKSRTAFFSLNVLTGRDRPDPMDSEPLPPFLERRVHALARSGTLNLIHERFSDLSILQHPQLEPWIPFLKVLDLTGTQISNLDGLPILPRIVCLITDFTSLDSARNIFSVRTVTSISLQRTPFQKTSHYKLCLYIAIGPDLVQIDGQQVTEVTRSRAKLYPKCTAALINAGWVFQYPPPSAAEFELLCGRFSVDFDDDRIPVAVIPEMKEKQIVTTDFDELADLLWNDHEKLLQKKLALFGIIEDRASDDEDEDYPAKIAALFQSHGIEVDPRDQEAILARIEGLCRERGEDTPV
jgi:hypothetical protein